MKKPSLIILSLTLIVGLILLVITQSSKEGKTLFGARIGAAVQANGPGSDGNTPPDLKSDPEFELYQSCYKKPEDGYGWIGTGDRLTDYRLLIKFSLPLNDFNRLAGSVISKAKLSESEKGSVNAALSKYVIASWKEAAAHFSYVPKTEGARDTYNFTVTPYLGESGWLSKFREEIEPIVGAERATIICNDSTVRQPLLSYGTSGVSITVSKDLNKFHFKYTLPNGSRAGAGDGGPTAMSSFGGVPVNEKILEIITAIRNGELQE